MIKDLEIALPSLAEQKRIVSTTDAVREETETRATRATLKLAAHEALKKSLLHQAFSGQLQRKYPLPATAAAGTLECGRLASAFPKAACCRFPGECSKRHAKRLGI